MYLYMAKRLYELPFENLPFISSINSKRIPKGCPEWTSVQTKLTRLKPTAFLRVVLRIEDLPIPGGPTMNLAPPCEFLTSDKNDATESIVRSRPTNSLQFKFSCMDISCFTTQTIHSIFMNMCESYFHFT